LRVAGDDEPGEATARSLLLQKRGGIGDEIVDDDGGRIEIRAARADAALVVAQDRRAATDERLGELAVGVAAKARRVVAVAIGRSGPRDDEKERRLFHRGPRWKPEDAAQGHAAARDLDRLLGNARGRRALLDDRRPRALRQDLDALRR